MCFVIQYKNSLNNTTKYSNAKNNFRDNTTVIEVLAKKMQHDK